MGKRATFGRRAPAQHQPIPKKKTNFGPSSPASPASSDAPLEAFKIEPDLPAVPRPKPVDPELEEWKRTRKKMGLFAWRPLYFMASLCFGLASFVLPDSVSDTLQWPLYVLAGASFYIGAKARRAKREARRAAKAERLETAAQNGI